MVFYSSAFRTTAKIATCDGFTAYMKEWHAIKPAVKLIIKDMFRDVRRVPLNDLRRVPKVVFDAVEVLHFMFSIAGFKHICQGWQWRPVKIRSLIKNIVIFKLLQTICIETQINITRFGGHYHAIHCNSILTCKSNLVNFLSLELPVFVIMPIRSEYIRCTFDIKNTIQIAQLTTVYLYLIHIWSIVRNSYN